MQEPHLKEFAGYKIVMNDYSGLRGDEMAQMIAKMMEFNRKQDIKPYLLLVDVTGCYANTAVVDGFKGAAIEMTRLADKTAVVGIKGIQEILLRAVRDFSSLDLNEFDTQEKAMGWLVS